MKATTATARAMTDAELHATRVRLKREIPAAESLLDAVKREERRRKRQRRQLKDSTARVAAASIEQLDLVGVPVAGLSPLSGASA